MRAQILVLLAFAGLAIQPTPGRAAGSSPGSADPRTPEAVLARVNERFGTVRDYECLAETYCEVGTKREARSLRLWYKAPGMLRVKVLRGRSSGSEAVVSNSGEIRGRKGGILKSIVLPLKPDDSRLCNLRGISATEFLWSTFYRGFRERAALPGARLDLLPRQDPEGTVDLALVWTAGGKSTRELLHVDPKQWLLQEIEVFEGDVRVDRAVFQAFKIDTGLKDSWFRL